MAVICADEMIICLKRFYKPTEYKPEDTVKTKLQEPAAGAKEDKGQAWVPGFGWVGDGGANVGTKVGNDNV